jgi:hypothetical protein
MLYSKDWDKTKTDPMSLDNLIAWLETKNPVESYHFTDSSQCMLAQWVRHLDPEAKEMKVAYNSYVYQVHGQIVDFKHTAFVRVASNQTNTFGEALERAQCYRPKEKRSA